MCVFRQKQNRSDTPARVHTYHTHRFPSTRHHPLKYQPCNNTRSRFFSHSVPRQRTLILPTRTTARGGGAGSAAKDRKKDTAEEDHNKTANGVGLGAAVDTAAVATAPAAVGARKTSGRSNRGATTVSAVQPPAAILAGFSGRPRTNRDMTTNQPQLAPTRYSRINITYQP